MNKSIQSLDANVILEMISLRDGNEDYLNELNETLCAQYITRDSLYKIVNVDGKPMAVDSSNKEFLPIKKAYCYMKYQELKESVCKKLDLPPYIQLDLAWILLQFQKNTSWNKEKK